MSRNGQLKKYITLHQNFYEDTLTPEAVNEGAKAVKQFSKRLRACFSL